jgi:hypothetical protein
MTGSIARATIRPASYRRGGPARLLRHRRGRGVGFEGCGWSGRTRDARVRPAEFRRFDDIGRRNLLGQRSWRPPTGPNHRGRSAVRPDWIGWSEATNPSSGHTPGRISSPGFGPIRTRGAAADSPTTRPAFGRAGDPEAQVAEPVARRPLRPIRRPADLGGVVPRPAAPHPQVALLGPHRIPDVQPVVLAVAVRTPLPDVAEHVVQAPGVRPERADRRRERVAVVRRLRPLRAGPPRPQRSVRRVGHQSELVRACASRCRIKNCRWERAAWTSRSRGRRTTGVGPWRSRSGPGDGAVHSRSVGARLERASLGREDAEVTGEDAGRRRRVRDPRPLEAGSGEATGTRLENQALREDYEPEARRLGKSQLEGLRKQAKVELRDLLQGVRRCTGWRKVRLPLT